MGAMAILNGCFVWDGSFGEEQVGKASETNPYKYIM